MGIVKLYYMTFALVGLILIEVNNSFANNPENKQNIYINIKNIKESAGAIVIAVYNSEKDYMKNPAYSQIAEVNDKGEVKVQAKLPFGSYAFTLFHDVNNNMELDTNFIGIPKEPYGFSNNSKSLLPPKFQAALVEFNEEGHEIEILLK